MIQNLSNIKHLTRRLGNMLWGVAESKVDCGVEMQKTVMFSFRRGVSVDEQNEFLETVRGWDGVSWVGRLEPEATHPDDFRICFAHVNTRANEERLMKLLKKNWSIETASVQPDRYAAAI